MAVQFELYKTPMPKEKKNKVRYHARPISYETVDTENLVYRIHRTLFIKSVGRYSYTGRIEIRSGSMSQGRKESAYRGIGISASHS